MARERPKNRREAKLNQRARLLEAMGRLVGAQGYAQTTVAHVIAEAGVSRKSFYEYFTDKEACFLAAYQELSERLIQVLVTRGAKASAATRTRVQLRLYLEVLQVDLDLTRAFMLEVLAAGPKALEVRETVNARFGELVIGHVARDAIILQAIIGGINAVVSTALRAPEPDLVNLLNHLVRFVNQASGRSAK